MIKRIDTNARLSHLVIHDGVAYLSGQVATTTAADIRAQTLEVLAKLDRLLALANTDKAHILSASVWLTDMAHFDAFNARWEDWVPAGTAPARACVQSQLANPACLVEIALTAAI